MRITSIYALSGPSLTGKTTACLDIVSRLRKNSVNAIFVPEPVRDSQHYYAQNFGPELCLEVFSLHLLLESRARFHGDVLILDRCLLDLLTFFRIKYKDNTEPELFSNMTDFSKAHLLGYRHIFLMDREIFSRDYDKFQSIDVIEHELFSAELKKAAIESNVSFSHLTQKNMVDQVVRRILADLEMQYTS